MKKEDILLFILGFLLLAGMLVTLFFGGEKSRHGVGSNADMLPENSSATIRLAHSFHFSPS